MANGSNYFRPVEQLLSFELSTPKTILPKQYAVRQMIASEVIHILLKTTICDM